MIYTVTFNPAIDYVVRLDTPLEVGEVNRAKGEDCVLGGKGINVSGVLAELGCRNTALGFVAGETGAWLERGLAAQGITTDFIHLEQGMTRRAPVLAQWLPVLFWLLLCSEVVNLLDQRLNPGGIWDGISTVVSVGLAIGLLVVFWKISSLSCGFRTVWRTQLALHIASVGTLVILSLKGDALDTGATLPGVAVAGLLVVAVGLVAVVLASLPITAKVSWIL
mgnify:CR=1 FL=1